ncbi:hypothetical protein [Cobetia marina]|uniref:hypothetical protein n=1 Tax=Cobetia marina TaxID=28258 RepID=UPI0011443B4C|nr:hypothetical protein [Cobetia marina]
MDKIDITDFQDNIDNDKGLTYHRRILVILSTTLICLTIAGAKIKEANTFIFKIEFEDPSYLIYFLVASILFIMLRYYSYSESYIGKFKNLLSTRILDDYRVFIYNPVEQQVESLLGKKVNVFGGDCPGIADPFYEIDGIFKRNIIYRVEVYDEEEGIGHIYYERIPLHQFNDQWVISDYIAVIRYELIYKAASVFKHREYLDIMFPMYLGWGAIIVFVFDRLKVVDNFISWFVF